MYKTHTRKTMKPWIFFLLRIVNVLSDWGSKADWRCASRVLSWKCLVCVRPTFYASVQKSFTMAFEANTRPCCKHNAQQYRISHLYMGEIVGTEFPCGGYVAWLPICQSSYCHYKERPFRNSVIIIVWCAQQTHSPSHMVIDIRFTVRGWRWHFSITK